MPAPGTIADIRAQLFRVPLDEVLGDAKHGDHTHFELVTVTVRTADGLEGTGYTYTGGKGGHAILALIEHDLAPFLLGRDGAEVEALNAAMGWHVHYVGRGGIAAFAISAVDIALWDIRCLRAAAPLWRMAGGTGRTTRAYRGGIDLNFSHDRLVESVAGHVAAGYDAVKIKVGRPTLAEDVARVGAVRAAIGRQLVGDSADAVRIAEAAGFALRRGASVKSAGGFISAASGSPRRIFSSR